METVLRGRTNKSCPTATAHTRMIVTPRRDSGVSEAVQKATTARTTAMLPSRPVAVLPM